MCDWKLSSIDKGKFDIVVSWHAHFDRSLGKYIGENASTRSRSRNCMCSSCVLLNSQMNLLYECLSLTSNLKLCMCMHVCTHGNVSLTFIFLSELIACVTLTRGFKRFHPIVLQRKESRARKTMAGPPFDINTHTHTPLADGGGTAWFLASETPSNMKNTINMNLFVQWIDVARMRWRCNLDVLLLDFFWSLLWTTSPVLLGLIKLFISGGRLFSGGKGV